MGCLFFCFKNNLFISGFAGINGMQKHGVFYQIFLKGKNQDLLT